MKIIGLTGKAGSGKDTVCGFMKEWGDANGVEVRRFAFADALKESAARSLGFTAGNTEQCVAFCNELKQPGMEVQIANYARPEPGVASFITGRQFLQFFGTEGHRDVFGEEFWVEQLFERILESCVDLLDGIVVVSDVRFPNEGSAINNATEYEGIDDAEIWEVVRPEQEKVEAHASEAGLRDGQIEFEIINSGDLIDLQNLVNSVCEHNLA